MTVSESYFFGNRCNGGGGGAWSSSDGWPRVINSVFAQNTAALGAALYTAGSQPTITNCTVSNNVASSNGGGIYNLDDFTTISNSILWGNSDPGGMDESAQLGGANWKLTGNCVEGWTGSLGGTGNTGDCAPVFVDADGKDNVAGTPDDNFRITLVSKNVDAGNDAADTDAPTAGVQGLPMVDADGNPRRFGVVDRGPYELQGPSNNRFLNILMDQSAGGDFALRVRLDSLHRPSGPPNAPNLQAFEGQYRYVNAIRNAQNQPVFDCPDSVSQGTSYKCAVLGCAPEYRDWSAIAGGQVLYVTGNAVVPSSVYTITRVPSLCAGEELTCSQASNQLLLSTERWGNVDGNPAGGTPNAIDLGFVVNKVKDVVRAFVKACCMLRDATPNPYGIAVNAQDVG